MAVDRLKQALRAELMCRLCGHPPRTLSVYGTFSTTVGRLPQTPCLPCAIQAACEGLPGRAPQRSPLVGRVRLGQRGCAQRAAAQAWAIVTAFYATHPRCIVRSISPRAGSARRSRTFMLVSQTSIWGTVGGGQFEFMAIAMPVR